MLRRDRPRDPARDRATRAVAEPARDGGGYVASRSASLDEAAYPGSMFRRVLIASVVLLAFVAATSRASSTSISPCRQVSQPIWSPDGTQIGVLRKALASADRPPQPERHPAGALHRERRRRRSASLSATRCAPASAPTRPTSSPGCRRSSFSCCGTETSSGSRPGASRGRSPGNQRLLLRHKPNRNSYRGRAWLALVPQLLGAGDDPQRPVGSPRRQGRREEARQRRSESLARDGSKVVFERTASNATLGRRSASGRRRRTAATSGGW